MDQRAVPRRVRAKTQAAPDATSSPPPIAARPSTGAPCVEPEPVFAPPEGVLLTCELLGEVLDVVSELDPEDEVLELPPLELPPLELPP